MEGGGEERRRNFHIILRRVPILEIHIDFDYLPFARVFGVKNWPVFVEKLVSADIILLKSFWKCSNIVRVYSPSPRNYAAPVFCCGGEGAGASIYSKILPFRKRGFV